MYSIKVGKLAHKVQIKAGYWNSNKIAPIWQILAYYSWIDDFSMWYLILHALDKPGELGRLSEDIELLLLGKT
jgi:hypothetical protein